MTTVKDVLGNLKKVNIPSLTAVVIKKNEKEIIRLNTDNMSKGLDRNDKLIGTYSKTTELIAEESKKTSPFPLEKKIAGKPYNLVWQGNLLPNTFITYIKNKIIFDSTGSGTGDKLFFVKDKKILGVSNKNAETINNQIIKPDLQKAFKQKTKL